MIQFIEVSSWSNYDIKADPFRLDGVKV